MRRFSFWALVALVLLSICWHDRQAFAEEGPTESECRPYIEKALHELKAPELDSNPLDSSENAERNDSPEHHDASETDEKDGSQEEDNPPDGSQEQNDAPESDEKDNEEETGGKSAEASNEDEADNEAAESADQDDGSAEDTEEADQTKEDDDDAEDAEKETQSKESESKEATSDENAENVIDDDNDNVSANEQDDTKEEGDADDDDNDDDKDDTKEDTASEEEPEKSAEQADDNDKTDEDEDDNDSKAEVSEDDDTKEDDDQSTEGEAGDADSKEADDSKQTTEDTEEDNDDSKEKGDNEESGEAADSKVESDDDDSKEDDQSKGDDETTDSKDADDDDDDDVKSKADDTEENETKEDTKEDTEDSEETEGKSDEKDDEESDEAAAANKDDSDGDSTEAVKEDDDEDDDEESEETVPEDDLMQEEIVSQNLRDRSHISEILYLDDEAKEKTIDHVAEIVLRDLKRIYENAIKPLEVTYKYRDLSNRHFGDSEIFSKPLVLFMGPWSGGKSTIINYLTGNEYKENALRSGAEPSPAYFNLLMYGDEVEVLDGTQLVADWTFSGLQKFGQGLEERLHGLKLPNSLLKKVNIVEIPGILEVRKQVSRVFPFNDACQWFIDRADIIFLVYDPTKLDVGPETEAILDQLKGREYQTRILLNKADRIKPEELLRVQSALVWNISPLMSSAQPPAIYTASLWSQPYEAGAPTRLLQAQEKAFLKDLRTAIDKRIENKIASARRFAVRVRNHAKMVDCYLTTYYNHKSLFGNKKRIADQIIDNPQNYHIYEGLSTLTNISRYDLPDPEVYRDFFRLNPLYEFKKLSETCTYFRGCPINKLDVAIAYDLPELIGKYKKMVETTLPKVEASDTS